MIKELFSKVSLRQREKAALRAADIRGVIVAIAEQELGITNGKAKLDLDHAATLLEEEGLSEADLRANVEQYKRRHRWAQDAAREAELEAEANRLRTAHAEASAAEIERRKKVLEELERMHTAARSAGAIATKATIAKAELEGSALLEVDEALNEQLAAVNSQIEKLRDGLRPNGTPGVVIGGHDRWGSLLQEPGRLVTKTKAMLAGKITHEKRGQLESQLAAAESAVEQFKTDITRLEKQRAEIVAKMTPNPADLLDPKNFQLIRRQPSRDNQRQLAGAIG